MGIQPHSGRTGPDTRNGRGVLVTTAQGPSMATTYSLELPRTLEAPSQARDALDRLDPELPEHVLPDLRLLVSELVSNGVKYGGDGPVRLEIKNEPDRIRAEI